MSKTGIFYSFNTKNTSRIAEKIRNGLGKGIEIVNMEDITEEQFLSFDYYILGVPTWFDGELPNYWDEFVPALEDMDLKGKTFALFGLGDQKGYPENFGDAIGILSAILEKQGGTIVGETSVEGFTFEKSRALKNGKFIGLMIDEDNQSKLTDQRINDWVKELKKVFK
jgi:flavodoxin I